MKRNQSMFFGLLALIAAFALSACGGANPAPPVVAHGHLDLRQTLPAPTPSPFVAYGERGTSSGRALTPNAEAEIAPYLRAQPHASGHWVASPPAQRAARKPVLPAKPEGDVAPVVASKDADHLVMNTDSARADAQTYAERESQKAETYRGGDTVVITVGTVLLVLLIVILILLIVR